jgi:hypothetical protein
MRLSRPALAFLVLVWVLVVLYPDPGVLLRSARNIAGARPDPAAAAPLAAALSNDPRLVEEYVLSTPYALDWETYAVPWYFPTAAEALGAPQGDCERRALMLASVLTAKGIPNELRVAPNHIWVDYPGKQASPLENEQLEMAGHRDGRFFLQFPGDLDLGEAIADQFEVTWAPMPLWRLVLLLVGLTLLPWMNVWAVMVRAGGPGRGAHHLLEQPAPAAFRRRPSGLPAAPMRRARRVT